MSAKIKELRKSKGLTQSDMSKLLGCSEAYYNMIENGRKTPSVSMAKKIARYTGVKWTLFFEDEIN